MIKNTRASKYRIIAVLANLLVLCLCILLWREAISVQPVYEEQIVTNEGSFVPTMDTIQHYSWSIDVPTEETAYTIVVTNAAEEQILEEQVQFDDALEVGAFMSISTLAEPVALDAADSYTVHFYQEDGSEFTERASLALYGEPVSLVGWYLAVCVLVLLITNAILILGTRYSVLSHGTVTILGATILLLLAILYNVAYRPLNVPDETIHFAVTYNYSAKFYYTANNGDRETSRLQTGIWKNMDELPATQRIYSFWYDDAYGNEITDQATETYGGYIAYPEYGYIPAALIVVLCKLLSVPYQVLLVIVRIWNYMVFLLLIAVSCKLAPDLRAALCAIASLPATIWLMDSYSYEGWNAGFAILFTAYLWRLTTNKEKIGLRQIIMMVLLLFAYAPIKYIYAILALLVLAIPIHQWKNLRIIIGAIVIGGAGVAVVLWSRLAEMIAFLMSDFTDTRGLDQGLSGSSFTLSLIWHHPAETALTFAKTFYSNLENMTERLLVGEFHSDTVPGYLTLILGVLFVSLLLYSTKESLTQRENTGNGVWTAWICRGVLILGILAVYGSFLFLYSYYNEGQIGVISGVQGRYFLPLVLLLAPGGSARLAGCVTDWMRKRNIAWEQIWAAFLYVGLLVMLCRIPGFME